MDRKSIIVLVVAVGVLFALSPVVDHFFPPKPLPISATATQTNAPEQGTLPSAPGSAPAPAASAPILAQPSVPEQTETVSNADLIWHFTSHGGGLKTVELRNYPAAVSRTARRGPETALASLNSMAPVPVLSVLGNGVQGDGYFTLTNSGGIVRAEKTLTNGLRLVKEFEPGTNYFFTARLMTRSYQILSTHLKP